MSSVVGLATPECGGSRRLPLGFLSSAPSESARGRGRALGVVWAPSFGGKERPLAPACMLAGVGD
eukprot:scaffold1954_cov268-Pinguiococcus_pyrenoidosus.AAC.85